MDKVAHASNGPMGNDVVDRSPPVDMLAQDYVEKAGQAFLLIERLG